MMASVAFFRKTQALLIFDEPFLFSEEKTILANRRALQSAVPKNSQIAERNSSENDRR